MNIYLGIALLVLLGTATVAPRTWAAKGAALACFLISLPAALFLLWPLGFANEKFLSGADGSTGPAFTAFLGAAVALNVGAQLLLRRRRR